MRFAILNRDNFTCQYCGRRSPEAILEIDHVHPRCEGGSDDPSNLKTACFNCNRGKATQLISVPLLNKRFDLSADNILVLLALEDAHASAVVDELTEETFGSCDHFAEMEVAAWLEEEYARGS